MSCTELEASIIRAGTALAQAPFGADLVRNHPSRRADPSGAGLADRELSAGPVVQRTVAVLNAAAITRTSPNLTDRDQRYVDWVNRVQRFLQALASELWGDIRGDIRHLFLDDDDLPPGPLSTSYIPALRKPHTRPMRSVAPDILLDPTGLAPLARMWSAAHDTIAYRAAAAAATSVRREQGLREKLAQTRRSYEEQLMPPRGPRYSDDVARERAPEGRLLQPWTAGQICRASPARVQPPRASSDRGDAGVGRAWPPVTAARSRQRTGVGPA